MSVFENFYNNINQKYGVSDQLAKAKQLLKKEISEDGTLVSILSNTGIAGFKFHCPQSEQVKFESDVTDYYVDTNTPVQDHIARKPITVTVNGLQGEYFYSVNPIEDTLALVQPTMKLVKQFLPKLSAATMQIKARKAVAQAAATPKYNPATGSYEISAGVSLRKNTFNAVDMFKAFQELYKLKSAQTRAYYFFLAMWRSEALFSVETPWQVLNNMVITSVVALRDNNADIADFTVTFKQISKTQSKTQTYSEYVAGRLKEQAAPVVDKGIDKGEKVEFF